MVQEWTLWEFLELPRNWPSPLGAYFMVWAPILESNKTWNLENTKTEKTHSGPQKVHVVQSMCFEECASYRRTCADYNSAIVFQMGLLYLETVFYHLWDDENKDNLEPWGPNEDLGAHVGKVGVVCVRG